MSLKPGISRGTNSNGIRFPLFRNHPEIITVRVLFMALCCFKQSLLINIIKLIGDLLDTRTPYVPDAGKHVYHFSKNSPPFILKPINFLCYVSTEDRIALIAVITRSQKVKCQDLTRFLFLSLISLSKHNNNHTAIADEIFSITLYFISIFLIIFLYLRLSMRQKNTFQNCRNIILPLSSSQE